MKRGIAAQVLAIAAVLILTVLVALPYVNGRVMETLLRSSLNLAGQRAAEQGMEIKFLEYHRGYAHTRMVWRLDPGPFGDAVLFSENAVHGFTGVTSETGLERNPWFAHWAEKNGTTPLTISTRCPLFGPVTVKTVLKRFTRETGGGPLISGPLTMTVTMDRRFTAFSIRAVWDGLQWDGPSFSDLNLDLQVDQVPMAALEHLGTVYAAVLRKTLAASSDPSLSPEARTRAMKSAVHQTRAGLLSGLAALLKKGLALRVTDFSVTLPEGKVAGRLSLTLKRDMTAAGLVAVMIRPAAILDTVSLASEIAVPRNLEGLDPALMTRPLVPGMKTGIFVADGNLLRHSAEIREGRLYVNGETVALE